MVNYCHVVYVCNISYSLIQIVITIMCFYLSGPEYLCNRWSNVGPFHFRIGCEVTSSRSNDSLPASDGEKTPLLSDQGTETAAKAEEISGQEAGAEERPGQEAGAKERPGKEAGTEEPAQRKEAVNEPENVYDGLIDIFQEESSSQEAGAGEAEETPDQEARAEKTPLLSDQGAETAAETAAEAEERSCQEAGAEEPAQRKEVVNEPGNVYDGLIDIFQEEGSSQEAGTEERSDQEARTEEQPQREQVINGWWIYLFQCFISNIC